jgi:hypothetical protein
VALAQRRRVAEHEQHVGRHLDRGEPAGYSSSALVTTMSPRSRSAAGCVPRVRPPSAIPTPSARRAVVRPPVFTDGHGFGGRGEALDAAGSRASSRIATPLP